MSNTFETKHLTIEDAKELLKLYKFVTETKCELNFLYRYYKCHEKNFSEDQNEKVEYLSFHTKYLK